MQAQIEELEMLFTPGEDLDLDEVDAAEKKPVGLTQVVLKKEWVRVQRGEHLYRMARFAALSVITACVLVLLVLFIMSVAGIWDKA